MYEYIAGTVAEGGLNYAVIDVGGIGYRVFTANPLPQGECKVFTYLHVREDVFDLYGFATKEERATFLMLIGVSGVGPKVALNVLATLAPAELAMAVASGDSKAITRVNGIGPKMAARVVLELKDKVAGDLGDLGGVKAEGFTAAGGVMGDAMAALMVLGYSADEAKRAVDGVEGATVEEVIKKALAKL